jgi:hypothetical protein|tara:strand:- start:28 stop:288 length:261 start_codon:yes stop_codon:yes gene_type:complete
MTLDQIVRIQGIIDKRAVRSDTLQFLNKTRYSHSKQSNIRYGDMHIDHFLRVVDNLEYTKESFEVVDETMSSLIDKIINLKNAKTN